MGIGAGISALGSLGAGLFSSNASTNAAKIQAQAEQQALALQAQEFAQNQANFAPYLATGSNAANQLTQQLPQLTSQFAPTESSLESTPGYQFDLSQGLKSAQNGAAARGLGVSGAALKGASTYATGLADNTLSTQFGIDQTNKTNSFNKLLGTSQLGVSGASGAGGVAANLTQQSSNTLASGATAQAAATTAAGTAFNPLLNNLGSYYSLNTLAGGLYGKSSSGGNSNGGLIGYGS